MKVKISNAPIINSFVQLPPSKSMAHRAIVCASLAHGVSTISNIDYSKDILATLQAMEVLGAKIIKRETSVVIEGINDFHHLNKNIVDCSESGSTLRFLIPLFSLCDCPVKFIGKGKLLSRPQNVYQDLFNEQGLLFKHNDDSIEINGVLKGQKMHIRGDISSQFITGLLFTLPLCKEDSTLHISEPFESKSYVDLTIQMLESFGIKIEVINRNTLRIPANQSYVASDIEVEGDYSQLGFFACLGALHSTLDCIGLRHDSLQGDKQLLDIFKDMKCDVQEIDNGYRFFKSNPVGTTIDLANCPDLGPILMVLCSYAQGESRIINASRLRIKESDRILAMETELKKCGVDISSSENEVLIKGNNNWITHELLNGHNDHRIVMSMAIGASVVDEGIIIDDAHSISKSYPSFFEDLKRLGINVEVIDDD